MNRSFSEELIPSCGIASATMGPRMPRYYFNIVSNAATVVDPDGTELATIEDARGEAVKDARALMSQAVLSGKDISGRKIHICDEQGALLLVVAFSETIRMAD
ncbi:DUF6894 family protein [Rhizobium phaseoli]|uniref:DUF6894 family protein n=2 Tax=Rhizobium phaseoli TaxID=396 RepID=UPI00184DF04D|nr:hypothetical protein [Rhizobium phaseoli]MDH6645583.1 hypothetical protein [Rhizobium esperanzae]